MYFVVLSLFLPAFPFEISAPQFDVTELDRRHFQCSEHCNEMKIFNFRPQFFTSITNKYHFGAFDLGFSWICFLNSVNDSVNSKLRHKSSNAFNCLLIKSALNCFSNSSFFNFTDDFASKVFNESTTLSLEIGGEKKRLWLSTQKCIAKS